MGQPPDALIHLSRLLQIDRGWGKRWAGALQMRRSPKMGLSRCLQIHRVLKKFAQWKVEKANNIMKFEDVSCENPIHRQGALGIGHARLPSSVIDSNLMATRGDLDRQYGECEPSLFLYRRANRLQRGAASAAVVAATHARSCHAPKPGGDALLSSLLPGGFRAGREKLASVATTEREESGRGCVGV